MTEPMTPERLAEIRECDSRLVRDLPKREPNPDPFAAIAEHPQSTLVRLANDRRDLLAEADRLRQDRCCGHARCPGESLCCCLAEKEALVEVDRLRANCGAQHATNFSIVPCMLPAGHDTRAPHWSTSGCAGGACQWFDEPKHWPGRLPAGDEAQP